jgi:hypothetical protein
MEANITQITQQSDTRSKHCMPIKTILGTPDRDQILRRYWDLANLDPKDTKENINGQLEALDRLCQELEREEVIKPAIPKPRPRAPQVYKSSWMN